jgi:hypothetical protein
MADETTQLLERIKRQGYTPRKTSEGHYEVIDREGRPVRLPEGQPFRFAATPSDSHSVKNSEQTLRRIGVLPAKNGDGRKLERDVLKGRSNDLRSEVLLLMDDHNHTQADISHFADRWAAQHGIAVPSYSQGVISRFLKGGYLSNATYPWLSAAMSAIRRNNGIIPSMEHPGRRDEPQPELGEVGVEVEGESPERNKLPELAFDVMQTIYKEEKDHEAIMALVLEVAKLEQQ